jgi:hypothetical protein
MSDPPSPMHTEDLELDERGAESVIRGAGTCKSDGGGIHKSRMTMSRAIRSGYQPIACDRNGMTLMKNRRSGRRSSSVTGSVDPPGKATR